MADMWMDVDAALAEVPVNLMPLIDDTDFKTRETAVAYNAAGMDLVWNFVTPAGAYTQTAVTPTTAGTYDWTHQGDAMYSIEIPASGGASINNDTEGFGWFSGVATGVLPWRGPVIGFRAAGLNDLLIESAFSATRGLAGTALPAAAADAAGGLVISDAGGLDADAQRADVAAILVDTGTTLDGRIPAALVSGRMDASVGAMAANVLTATAINANAINAAKLDPDVTTELQSGLATAAALDAVDNFVDTEIAAIITTLGTPAGASLAADIAAVQADTDNLQTRVPAALVGGRMDSSVGAMAANTMTAAASAADFLAEINAEADTALADAGVTTTVTGRIDAAISTRATPAQILTTAMTESYAADGAAPTLAQAVFAIQQMLQERSISSTTLTVKKLDGSTTAMTFTLDSASSPTSITRAT